MGFFYARTQKISGRKLLWTTLYPSYPINSKSKRFLAPMIPQIFVHTQGKNDYGQPSLLYILKFFKIRRAIGPMACQIPNVLFQFFLFMNDARARPPWGPRGSSSRPPLVYSIGPGDLKHRSRFFLAPQGPSRQFFCPPEVPKSGLESESQRFL